MKTLFSIFAVAVAALAISCGNTGSKPAAGDSTATIQEATLADTTKCCEGDSTKCCEQAAEGETAPAEAAK
ncbi:MAG: hypothetical protein LBH06_04825 [Rikenellaceae bacterium]|jgi:hypothetical protein|nr:hypothetical protein [Rikenellaceae bacterium]